jgi:hypothetical protein
MAAETPRLTLDSGVSGTDQLSVTPPPGVPAPTGNPSSVTLTGGQSNFTMTFATAGVFREGRHHGHRFP